MGRVDVALEEYKALRAEILARQQSQITIVNVALTATAAIAGVTFAVDSSGTKDRLDILLALPIVLCGLGLAYLTHTHASHLIGTYIGGTLWPELRQAEPAEGMGSTSRSQLPSWEETVAGWRTLDKALATPGGYLSWMPGVFIFGVPSAVALILNWKEAPNWIPFGAEGGELSAAWFIGAIAIMAAIVMMFAVAYTSTQLSKPRGGDEAKARVQSDVSP